jgi:hypothetical protein
LIAAAILLAGRLLLAGHRQDEADLDAVLGERRLRRGEHKGRARRGQKKLTIHRVPPDARCSLSPLPVL